MTRPTPAEHLPPELWASAFHEAGHAVAAVVAGGRIVAVPPIREDGTGEVATEDVPDSEVHFLTFAGPWAEAAFLSSSPVGNGFAARLDFALLRAKRPDFPGHDWQVLTTDADGRPLEDWWWDRGQSDVWSARLAAHWASVVRVAAMLIARLEVTDASVRALCVAEDTNGMSS